MKSSRPQDSVKCWEMRTCYVVHFYIESQVHLASRGVGGSYCNVNADITLVRRYHEADCSRANKRVTTAHFCVVGGQLEEGVPSHARRLTTWAFLHQALPSALCPIFEEPIQTETHPKADVRCGIEHRIKWYSEMHTPCAWPLQYSAEEARLLPCACACCLTYIIGWLEAASLSPGTLCIVMCRKRSCAGLMHTGCTANK